MVHRNPAARSQPAPFLLLAIAAVVGTPQAWSSQSDIDADEEVVFFPTCASYDEVKAQWDVPIHAWVFEPEADSQTRQAALALFRKSLGLAEAQSEHFEERAAAFLVDNERGQTLEINFGQRRFDLGRSGANGHLRAVFSYPMCPERLWEFDPWLGFTPRLKPGDTRRMKGSVQFVRPRGLSVITDIDDTIKVSEVSDKARLLKNTFLEPYEAVAAVSSGGSGLGGSWYFGTTNYNTSGMGFPRPGETYEVEVRIQVFETDIPTQHMWSPGSPKYKVLWTRTLRQST